MQSTESSKPRSLAFRGVRRMGITVLVLAFLLFVPAGTLHFWEAWVYLGLQAGFWAYFFLYFLKHDPELSERRLQSKESEPQQKLAVRLFSAVLWVGFILIGLDHRLQWSHPRPSLAGIVTAQVLVVAGYWIVFWVMKTNTFAASVIRVESGHRVIDTGPYGWVRHPMYTGMAVTALATPIALGSYVALPVFALMIPVLGYRLIHEERLLCRDLAGYSEYCGRTRYRLVPGIW